MYHKIRDPAYITNSLSKMAFDIGIQSNQYTNHIPRLFLYKWKLPKELLNVIRMLCVAPFFERYYWHYQSPHIVYERLSVTLSLT